MSSIADTYQSKLMTCEALVKSLKPDTMIYLSVWYGEPYGVVNALNTHGQELESLYVVNGIATAPSPYMAYPGVNVCSAFYGPQERAYSRATKNITYIPTNFTDVTRLLKQGRPLDYLVYRVGPMDEEGYFNCSLTAGSEYDAVSWIRKNRPETKLVFEVNSNLPFVHGLAEHGDHKLSIEIPDIIVEDDSPLMEFPTAPPNAVEQKIANNVAELVRDRDTLQIGFGTIPMAIGSALMDRRELGIHTEMFCEAHISLIEGGVVTNTHKGLYDGVSIGTFSLGTKRMHDWMADNRGIALLPVDAVNRVDVLARVNNLTSINAVLGVDVTGQTCAHCLHNTTYSGLGGAFEFAYGSQLSPGGQSIVCLPSTTTLKDGTVVSNILAQFPQGTRITTPEHVVEWVVTEYGSVNLKSMSIEQRVQALINISHPDFREPLAKDVKDYGFDLSMAERAPVLSPYL